MSYITVDKGVAWQVSGGVPYPVPPGFYWDFMTRKWVIITDAHEIRVFSPFLSGPATPLKADPDIYGWMPVALSDGDKALLLARAGLPPESVKPSLFAAMVSRFKRVFKRTT